MAHVEFKMLQRVFCVSVFEMPDTDFMAASPLCLVRQTKNESISLDPDRVTKFWRCCMHYLLDRPFLRWAIC